MLAAKQLQLVMSSHARFIQRSLPTGTTKTSLIRLSPTDNPVCYQSRWISVSPKLLDSYNIQDDDDFKTKVLSAVGKSVVVEFHASWCGPCKLLMPRLETRIGCAKNVDLAKVDIDSHPDLAMEYGVGAVPSVLAFKDGKIVDKFVGLKDEDQIDKFIKKLG